VQHARYQHEGVERPDKLSGPAEKLKEEHHLSGVSKKRSGGAGVPDPRGSPISSPP